MKRALAVVIAAAGVLANLAEAAPPVVIASQAGKPVMQIGGFGQPGKSATESTTDPGGASTDVDPAQENVGHLRWQNGESLPGEIVGATAEELSWQSPLFEEPLVLRWEALRRFDRPAEPGPVTDPFAFTFRDASHVYGDLVALDSEDVLVRSQRHGEAHLRRGEILNIRRISRNDLPAGGSTGFAGWLPLADPDGHGQFAAMRVDKPPTAAAAPLVTGPGGALELPYWNTATLREMPLPERVEVDFQIHSDARPAFIFALLAGASEGPRVETWDNEVVLAQGDRFLSLGLLEESARQVAYRVCWDRASNRCVVYTIPDGTCAADSAQSAAFAGLNGDHAGDNDPAGQKSVPGLAGWRPALTRGRVGKRTGLALLNKGRNLTLDSLRVQAWDGSALPSAAGASGGVLLGDGREVPGDIINASSEGGLHVRSASDGTTVSVPLADVDEILFSRDAPALPANPPMILKWADGTLVCGSVTGFEDGTARLVTAWSRSPLLARAEDLGQLMLPRASAEYTRDAPTFSELDKLAAGPFLLHGHLTSLPDGQLGWLPVGGTAPSVPSRHQEYVVDRVHPPTDDRPPAPAMIYPSTDDLFPAVLRSIDESGVEFTCDYLEAKHLAPRQLDAVEFTSSAPPRVESFNDAGWQIVKGNPQTVTRSGDGTLELSTGTALCHPTLLPCSELHFLWSAATLSGLRLRLFCARTDTARSTNLALMLNGGMLYYGLETNDGQIDSQQHTQSRAGQVEIRLVFHEQQVDLCVDGRKVADFTLPLGDRAGTGLVVEPAELWGSQVHRVTLADFAAEYHPGQIGLPIIDPEALSQALTVPRFRQDHPPREILIAANGDVLRGEITASTASQFAFRSGLEELRIPRDRVRAAVWLKPPVKGGLKESQAATPPRLEKRVLLNGQYGNMRLQDFMAMISQWDGDLRVKYSPRIAGERRRMRFEQPTLGEALAEVSAAFGVRYRLDGDEVIFTEAGALPPNMTRAMYWLKPGSFPDDNATQSILAAADVAFPEGAFASWDAGSQQLTSVNTEENQRRLLDLLTEKFVDGKADGPTHWLTLTDGTRLGIAADRFDADAITGHHPVYGQCRVPLSAVTSIRSAPPERTAAGKMFAGWHLIPAPAPALGPDGAAAALAGKEARDFTLPMPGGGEFTLAHERGKVIVLCFWATWSPPCITSLPGLVAALEALPADNLHFVGVNAGEPSSQVKRFLRARGWQFDVALDESQEVSNGFGADALPEVVVVAPDGKVARVWTNYTPDVENEVADLVRKLLPGSAARLPEGANEAAPAAGPASPREAN